MTAPRRWRVALASAASAAMLIAAPLVGAQAASAQPYPPPPPPLTLSATTVTAGGALTFSSAAGIFAPGATITALLESTPVELGHFQAGADGSVAGTVTIPTNVVTGWHVFRLTADNPDPSIGVTIFVQGGVTPPPTPTHRPTHKPGHGKPGHGKHDGRDDGHKGSHGRVLADDPVSYQQQNQHPGHDSKSLAATGSDKTLALGGTAAALLVAGGGAMLTVRRRRSS